MGRGRARTQRKHFSKNRENVWKKSRSDNNNNDENNNNDTNNNTDNTDKKIDRSWEPFATQNPAFDSYYKEQGIVSPDEWDMFMEMLRKPLPAAFRINSSSQFSEDIKSQLENDFMNSLQAEAPDGSEVEGIKPLPWYPDNLAWHSNFSRMQLRKNQTLVRFHDFLKQENEIGNITRQEAVSMVPPLFLDVLPEHFVLDMCAAPGSKTFQLLEMIYRLTESGSLPSGMVIANDSDVQRCNLLIHQTKRMCTANLIVTNHEAQHFPSCHLNKNRANGFGNRDETESGLTQLLFDRVLCDVPCSGDGTLRKAPDIWRRWSIGTGNGIHGLQIQIAMRGLSLLKVGGRMVYSTCSMNPVENEAVVSEILRRCGGSVELVDVSSELPQLIRRPGLKKWKVRDKINWFGSHKDVPKSRRAAFMPSMFPSGKGYVEIPDNDNDALSMDAPDNHLEASMDVLDEEISDLPLERCMRILPHDQNTGAFFVAVLHKLSPLPAVEKKPTTSRDQLNRKVDSADDNLISKVKEDVNEDTDGLEVSLVDVAEEPLKKTATYPDLMNTKSEEPASVSDSAKVTEENKTKVDVKGSENKASGGKRKLQMQGKWKGVDPVLFFKSDSIVDCIKTFYGINETIPFKDHLVTRNTDADHVKRIYYVSKSVKDVLQLNLQGGQQLKITSIGLKMFERQTSKECSSSPCMFRISSEGLPLMLPHITNQILYASLVDFKHLLQYRTIKFADFVDANFGEKASKLEIGCCVVVLREGAESTPDPPRVDASTIAIGAWRGRTNIAVMVTVTDSQELLERLSVRMGIKNGSSVLESEPAGADNVETTKYSQIEDVEAIEDAIVS